MNAADAIDIVMSALFFVAFAGGAATAALVAVFVLRLGSMDEGDADVGLGLVLLALCVAVGATGGALARSVRHGRHGG
jgi:hypothetical protein